MYSFSNRYQRHSRPFSWGISDSTTVNQTETPAEPEANTNLHNGNSLVTRSIITNTNGVDGMQIQTEDSLPPGSALNIARSTHNVTSTSGSNTTSDEYQKKQTVPFTRYGFRPSSALVVDDTGGARSCRNMSNNGGIYRSQQFNPIGQHQDSNYLSSSHYTSSQTYCGSSNDASNATPRRQYDYNQAAASLRSVNVINPSGMSSDQQQRVSQMLSRTGSCRYTSVLRRSLESNLALWGGGRCDAHSTTYNGTTGQTSHPGAKSINSSLTNNSSTNSVGESSNYPLSFHSLSPLERLQGEVQGRLRGIELFHHWLVLPETRAQLQRLIDDHIRMMEEGGKSKSPIVRPNTPPSLVSTCGGDNKHKEVGISEAAARESVSSDACDNKIHKNVTQSIAMCSSTSSTSTSNIDCCKNPPSETPLLTTNTLISNCRSDSSDLGLLCREGSSSVNFFQSPSSVVSEMKISISPTRVLEVGDIDVVHIGPHGDNKLKSSTDDSCSSLVSTVKLKPDLLDGNVEVPLSLLELSSSSQRRETMDKKINEKERDIVPEKNKKDTAHVNNVCASLSESTLTNEKERDIVPEKDKKDTAHVNNVCASLSESTFTPNEKERLKCATTQGEFVLPTIWHKSDPCIKQATFQDIPRFYFPLGRPLKRNHGESIKDPLYTRHENPHLKTFDGIALPYGQLSAASVTSETMMGPSCLNGDKKKNCKEDSTNMLNLEHLQVNGEEILCPGYKLAKMQTLSVVRDTDVMCSITDILSKVPTISVGTTSVNNKKPRVVSAKVRSNFNVLSKRPGSSNTAANIQTQYIAERAAYREATYVAVCKICTDVFGLPKYFATIVMRIIQKDSKGSSWITNPLPHSPSRGKSRDGVNAQAIFSALPWTDESNNPQILDVQRFIDFHDVYLKGKCAVRRIFDVLCESSTRKNRNTNQGPVSGVTTDDLLSSISSCNASASDGISVLYTPVEDANVLYKEDFVPYLESLLELHPGLVFLKQTADFQQKYIQTILVRIFFDLDQHDRGYIVWSDFERSKLVDALRQVDQTEDINTVLNFFSYEHFYVIYCRFWELDTDRDMLISQEDLMRYFPQGTENERVVQRVFEGHGRRLANQPKQNHKGNVRVRSANYRKGALENGMSESKGGRKGHTCLYQEKCDIKMTYEDFVWFCLCEEDKSSARSIRYWFRILDLDGDGIISGYELEEFYSNTKACIAAITPECITFEDIMCQISDMLPVLSEVTGEVVSVNRTTHSDNNSRRSTEGQQKENGVELPSTAACNTYYGKCDNLLSVKCNDSDNAVSSSLGRWFRFSTLSGKGMSIASNNSRGENESTTRLLKKKTGKCKNVSTEKHDNNDNSVRLLESQDVKQMRSSDINRYHRYGITLKDLLSRPSYAYVVLNMILNAVKFLQFEQKDPFVSHQERLMGGYEGNEWDRFARAEYDRMAVND